MSIYAEASHTPTLTLPQRPRSRASTYCNRPLPPLPSPNESSQRKRPRRSFRTTNTQCLSQFPTPPPLLFPREQVNALSLQDHAFLYILGNMDQYPPELLALLPVHLRKKFLSALPPFRLYELERMPIARDIDTDSIWETLSIQQDCVWGGYLKDKWTGTTKHGMETKQHQAGTQHDSPRMCFVNYLSHLMFNEMNRDYACKRITELLHAIHVDMLDPTVGNALVYGHVSSLFMFQPPYYLIPFRCRNLLERELYWLLYGNQMLPRSLELYTYNIEYSPLWNQELISQGLMRRLMANVTFLRVYNHMHKTFLLQEIMNAVTHSSRYKDPPSLLGSLKHLEILRADDRHLSTVVPYFSAPHGYSNLTSLTISMRPVDYIQATRHLGPIIRHQLNTLQHLELRGFNCYISTSNTIDLCDYMLFASLVTFILKPRCHSLTFHGFTNMPWVLVRMLLEAGLRTVPSHRQAITFRDVNVTTKGELPFSDSDEEDVEDREENQFYPASESKCLEHKQLHFQNCQLPEDVFKWFKGVDRVYLIVFYLVDQEGPETSSSRNAFEILMNSQKRILLPQKHVGDNLRADQRMKNDFIDLLSSWSVGWTPDNVQTLGQHCIKTVVSALWYLDPHHDSFKDRSLAIPPCFAKFTGYNDWRRKKEKHPRLSQGDLDRHVQAVSSILCQPWSHKPSFKMLRSQLAALSEVMKQYCDYLKKHTETMKLAHSSTTVLRQVEENIMLETRVSVPQCNAAYGQIQEKLLSLPFYEPVFVNDFSPLNRYERKHWLEKLHLEFPVKMYRYSHGNNVGTMTFLWCLPSDSPEDSTSTAQAISILNTKQKQYYTRQMRRDFLSRYSHFVKAPTSILRHMFKELVHDSSAATSAIEQSVDDRVAKAVVELQDPDIITDLRRNNGKVQSSFEDFWSELQKYLDEIITPVNERRHGSTMYMPIAISVRDLREIVTERLAKAFPGEAKPVPSEEWLRLQFWPRNPYAVSALRYTGRFHKPQKICCVYPVN